MSSTSSDCHCDHNTNKCTDELDFQDAAVIIKEPELYFDNPAHDNFTRGCLDLMKSALSNEFAKVDIYKAHELSIIEDWHTEQINRLSNEKEMMITDLTTKVDKMTDMVKVKGEEQLRNFMNAARFKTNTNQIESQSKHLTFMQRAWQYMFHSVD